MQNSWSRNLSHRGKVDIEVAKRHIAAPMWKRERRGLDILVEDLILSALASSRVCGTATFAYIGGKNVRR